ncbi:phosphate regulon sensor protein PhoR [mine drainage metagenome]|uniref:Phosphate regulon sensor protein PhoR n=1 Tax=mine drainage metagenome TaxID=410659 RepID=T1AET4_9ZZZZ
MAILVNSSPGWSNGAVSASSWPSATGGSRTSFARLYTDADVLVLAHTDTLHGTLSGLATKKLMERAYGVFGDGRYERLATISVAHLYNLRRPERSDT